MIEVVRQSGLDLIDFQLDRGFRSQDLDYPRSLCAKCEAVGIDIGYVGVGSRGFVGVDRDTDRKNQSSICETDEDRIVLDQETADDQVAVSGLYDQFLLEFIERVYPYHLPGRLRREGEAGAHSGIVVSRRAIGPQGKQLVPVG